MPSAHYVRRRSYKKTRGGSYQSTYKFYYETIFLRGKSCHIVAMVQLEGTYTQESHKGPLVLGPLLWNIVYDGLLYASDPVKDLDAVAFTDDLAQVITMRKLQDIGDKVREAMKVVTEWCADTKDRDYIVDGEARPENL
jgi:hypothetical protein